MKPWRSRALSHLPAALLLMALFGGWEAAGKPVEK